MWRERVEAWRGREGYESGEKSDRLCICQHAVQDGLTEITNLFKARNHTHTHAHIYTHTQTHTQKHIHKHTYKRTRRIAFRPKRSQYCIAYYYNFQYKIKPEYTVLMLSYLISNCLHCRNVTNLSKFCILVVCLGCKKALKLFKVLFLN